MENFNKPESIFNDPQKLRKIMRYMSIFKIEVDLNTHWGGYLFLGEKVVTPHRILLKLSKDNPDLTFKASYEHQYYEFSTTYIVKYKNGQVKDYDIEEWPF
ncbi:MAG: hypothetical protein JXA60_12105 [Candidatus Coatesbacteria bacterium]|nr:hypothetical protein [Candidatus Coatesbacteria bacterium]